MLPPFSGSETKHPESKPVGRYSWTLKTEAVRSSETSHASTRLHGVTSLKIVVFSICL
jgi:hypothetical protein